MLKPTIGTDPEFFLVQRGYVRSAHGLIPGNKANPHKLEKGACQLDGVAVEFNIDPAKTADEFATNIETVLKQVREIVPKEYSFHFSPYVQFGAAHWNSIPAEHKQLGCDPDFASLYGEIGQVINSPNPGSVRTGSGHIHIGWTEGADVKDPGHQTDAMYVAQRCFLWTESIRYVWDQDNRRHVYYGKAGAHRPKPYGVEYRSPSNVWVKYPKLWPYIFQLYHDIFVNMQDEESKLHGDGYKNIWAYNANDHNIDDVMSKVMPNYTKLPKNWDVPLEM